MLYGFGYGEDCGIVELSAGIEAKENMVRSHSSSVEWMLQSELMAEIWVVLAF